jgi:hypothetical protein
MEILMNSVHTIQKTIRLTPELWLLAEQAMMHGKFRNINDFIRTCIRSYVDETGDTLGSRRYFNNRMSQRMDRLEATSLWSALQTQKTQMLMARGIFTILDELTPEDADAEPPTPDVQIAHASEASKRFLAKFLDDQSQIILQLEQHLSKKHAAKSDKPDKTGKS